MSKHKATKQVDVSPWPRLSRGHSNMGPCPAQNCTINRGSKPHYDPAGNQADWEESVGRRFQRAGEEKARRVVQKVAKEQRRRQITTEPQE